MGNTVIVGLSPAGGTDAVWHAGFRYRLNVRNLPGNPDLLLPRYRVAFLVHGCFWHSHQCPKGQRRLATNSDFWNRKLDGNVARDAANQVKLAQLGWTAFIIWECSLVNDTNALHDHLSQMRRTNSLRSATGAALPELMR